MNMRSSNLVLWAVIGALGCGVVAFVLMVTVFRGPTGAEVVEGHRLRIEARLALLAGLEAHLRDETIQIEAFTPAEPIVLSAYFEEEDPAVTPNTMVIGRGELEGVRAAGSGGRGTKGPRSAYHLDQVRRSLEIPPEDGQRMKRVVTEFFGIRYVVISEELERTDAKMISKRSFQQFMKNQNPENETVDVELGTARYRATAFDLEDGSKRLASTELQVETRLDKRIVVGQHEGLEEAEELLRHQLARDTRNALRRWLSLPPE